MTGSGQETDQFAGTLVVIVDHTWVIQLFIIVIVKDDGNLFRKNIPVAVQIGI